MEQSSVLKEGPGSRRVGLASLVYGGGSVVCFLSSALVALIIATGICARCDLGSSAPTERIAFLGAGLSLVLATVCWFAQAKKLNDLRDFCRVIALAIGSMAIVAIATTGAKPCPLCTGYWMLMGLAIAPLFVDTSAGSVKWLALSATILFCVYVLIFNPITNFRIGKFFGAWINPRITPVIGSRLSQEIGAPSNGVCVFVTDCPPCFRPALKILQSKEFESLNIFYVMCPASAWAAQEIKSGRSKLVDAKAFEQSGISVSGPPILLTIQDGRVKAAQTVTDFLQQRSQR